MKQSNTNNFYYVTVMEPGSTSMEKWYAKDNKEVEKRLDKRVPNEKYRNNCSYQKMNEREAARVLVSHLSVFDFVKLCRDIQNDRFDEQFDDISTQL